VRCDESLDLACHKGCLVPLVHDGTQLHHLPAWIVGPETAVGEGGAKGIRQIDDLCRGTEVLAQADGASLGKVAPKLIHEVSSRASPTIEGLSRGSASMPG